MGREFTRTQFGVSRYELEVEIAAPPERVWKAIVDDTTLWWRRDFYIGRSPKAFVIEKKVGERADLFVEYVGDFPDRAGPRHLLNSGGAYRLTPTQQIDFHVGFGLNRNAPNWLFGLGYSIRRDRLF